MKALHADPQLQGIVWYDSFSEQIRTGPTSREWIHDLDDVRLTHYLQESAWLTRLQPAQVRAGVALVAHQSERHVVREWLRTLEWDREPRLELAFEDFWGVETGPDQPCEYVRAASKHFFLGLIARIMRPGCQLDTMVVFESAKQGVGKSSALRLLGGDWYAQQYEPASSKDFFQTLRGKWVIEIGELHALSRADVGRIKTVISTPVDTYRPSYGQSARDYPRQCIFAGTTNTDDWGRDETGLRRFWPVRVGQIDTDALARIRTQLYAEAVARYDAGESWWQMPTSTVQVQAGHQAEDAWASLVIPWLVGRSEVTIFEVLSGPLRLRAVEMTPAAQQTVGRILRLNGWQKRNLRRDGLQTKIWVLPQDPQHQDPTVAAKVALVTH